MSIWSDEDRHVLRTMWACGRSSGSIAAALSNGVSRNAVMGMVNRLGLMGLNHADERRLAAISKVSELLDAPFSTGEPLHREALLALLVGSVGRGPGALAAASGMDAASCVRFLDRLDLVWPAGQPMPGRWIGSLEGLLAFILDIALLAGRIDHVPVRGRLPMLAA